MTNHRILAFGTYDASTHPRVGVLIEGLRAHGAEIREANIPLGLSTADRVTILRQPWRVPILGTRIVGRWLRLIRAARRTTRSWSPEVILVGYLGHFDVLLARRLFPRATIMLDHLIFAADTARDRGDASAVKQSLLRRLDNAAIAAADVVVLDTPQHAELLAELLPEAADRAVVVPVGATSSWFAAAASTGEPAAAEGPLSVIFFGLYTPLQGAPVIGAAIAALAGLPIRFTMIGTGQDLPATRSAAAAAGPDAVRWLDWVDPAELPGLVARHDVCLGVFGVGAKALRVVPNKVYQGAAAGCSIITSDTSPQRSALGGDAVLVPPGDSEALAVALRLLANDRDRVQELRAAAHRRALTSFTAKAVTAPLQERLDSLRGGGTPDGDTMHPMTTNISANSHPLPPLPPRAWLRYDVVRDIVDDLAPRTVLELGCGQGSFGARLAANQIDYLGIEPDTEAADVARQRITPHGGVVITGDQHAVPAGSTYDLVCAFEVLEHLEHDAEMLAVWAGFVRPGGHLLISVPAWQQRFGPMDTHAGHYRRYSPTQLAELMRNAGLDQVATTVYAWPLGYALEAVRNRIDARKLSTGAADLSMAERTASTGRTFQPPNRRIGAAVALGVMPFRYLQRLAPTRGTGLVTVARRPENATGRLQ